MIGMRRRIGAFGPVSAVARQDGGDVDGDPFVGEWRGEWACRQIFYTLQGIETLRRAMVAAELRRG